MTDRMWAQLEPLLPDRSPRRGGQWREHREVVEAIIWRVRTGSPWRDLPEDFPAWQTVWWRFDRWSRDGTWDRVLTALVAEADARGVLDWTVAVDSTINRAHQHATNTKRDTGGPTELQESGRGAA